MIIFPAIDLQGGHCVRLKQGRADAATVYSDDPVAMACQWQAAGAEALHVVDLDGAFAGAPRHAEVIARIVRAIRIPVQVGGGLRTDADVAQVLATGAARAILGTRALDDETALARLVARHGAAIAVGLDARDGFVQVKGWVETTAIRATDLAQRVAAAGVQTLIYTDTATDGMLGGPNLAALDQLCRTVTCRVIASGGVSSADHVRALVALGHPHLYGAIVGKALYDGRTTMTELLDAAACRPSAP